MPKGKNTGRKTKKSQRDIVTRTIARRADDNKEISYGGEVLDIITNQDTTDNFCLFNVRAMGNIDGLCNQFRGTNDQ